MRTLRNWSLRIVSLSAVVGACTSGGGGDGGGLDAGDDGSADARDDVTLADGGIDADASDAGDATLDATADAEPDAEVDAGSDAEAEAGSDAGTSTALYDGPTLDFAVDATNLYLLLPTATTIAKCPLAGCGGAPPTTVLTGSHAQEVEASLASPTLYFGYEGFGPHAVRIDSIDSDGVGPAVNRWIYGGPPNLRFQSLRYNNGVVYGSVRAQGMGTPAFYMAGRYLEPGAGTPFDHHGSPVYDVRGDFGIEYDDNASPTGPRKYHSRRMSTGESIDYAAGPETPVEIRIFVNLVAFRTSTGDTYFCARPGCATPTLVPGVVSASLAIDADYLYMATAAGVVRCSTAEMTSVAGGTCTAQLFAPTAASSAQLVITPTTLYVRTAVPSIIAVPIP